MPSLRAVVVALAVLTSCGGQAPVATGPAAEPAGPGPAAETAVAAGPAAETAVAAGPAAEPSPAAKASRPEHCPPRPPRHEEACDAAAFRAQPRCRYDEVERCPFAFCAQVGVGASARFVWQVSVDHCRIVCPKDLPSDGSACPPHASSSCDYPGGKACGLRAHCAGGRWTIKDITLCDGM